MYCSYCAGVLDAGQAVCPKCGRAAPVAAPVAAVHERPSSVRLAALLLAIALGVGILSLAGIFLGPGRISRLPVSFFLRTTGFTILELALLVCVWQRQGWARFGIGLLLIYGVGNLLITMLRVGGAAVFGLLVPALVDALRIWALVLLFRAESNNWYGNPHEHR